MNLQEKNIKNKYDILFYLPNLIGYCRLLFVFLGFYFVHYSPGLFVILYTVSIILDAFDGYAARKLHQCSIFGAWLDIAIDNISRGLLWAHLHPFCYLISTVEWITFVFNHQNGPNWKKSLVDERKSDISKQHPKFISSVMRNNFRNPLGVWAIAGLHVLPLWLYGIKFAVFHNYLAFIPSSLVLTGLFILASGRILCGLVEMWCIWNNIKDMLVNTSIKED